MYLLLFLLYFKIKGLKQIYMVFRFHISTGWLVSFKVSTNSFCCRNIKSSTNWKEWGMLSIYQTFPPLQRGFLDHYKKIGINRIGTLEFKYNAQKHRSAFTSMTRVQESDVSPWIVISSNSIRESFLCGLRSVLGSWPVTQAYLHLVDGPWARNAETWVPVWLQTLWLATTNQMTDILPDWSH